MTTFYIVRHGETDWNTIRKVQGHSDIELNAMGEQQARAAGIEFQDVHFDRVFSSDLLRARRTAELIVAERNLAITTAQALRERSYGKLEGALLHESQEFFSQLARAANQTDEDNLRRMHSMETTDTLVSRVFTFLRELAVTYPKDTILIVSHGGLMRALLEHLGYYTHKTGEILRFQNTGYLKIECDGVEFFLKEIKRAEVMKR